MPANVLPQALELCHDAPADLRERARAANERLLEIQQQTRALSGKIISHGEVAEALAAFDPIWQSLSPCEQTRVVQLLVQCVEFDGHKKKVAVTFHPDGMREFADEFGEDAA